MCIVYQYTCTQSTTHLKVLTLQHFVLVMQKAEPVEAAYVNKRGSAHIQLIWHTAAELQAKCTRYLHACKLVFFTACQLGLLSR